MKILICAGIVLLLIILFIQFRPFHVTELDEIAVREWGTLLRHYQIGDDST